MENFGQAEAERIEREYLEELTALQRDPWFVEPTREFGDSDTIGGLACVKVDKQSVSAAVAMLRNSPSNRLDRDASVALIGAERTASVSRPVLLRAFATEHSNIEVRSLNGSTVLWLGYLGSFAGASRWPCVADLAEAPSSVAFVLSGAV